MAQLVFKGIKQVSAAAFAAETNKVGYLWFVRTPATETTPESGDVYFGTRHYGHFGDVSDAAATAKIENILTTLGNAFDENGEWQGFLPAEEHPILGDLGEKTTLTDALVALESAITLVKGDITALAARVSTVESEVATIKEKGIFTDNFSIVKVAAGEGQDEIAAVYNLVVGSGETAQLLGSIDIPKDRFLKSGSYNTETKTLQLVVLQADGTDGTITIPVEDLVDTYTAGTGLKLSGTTFSVDEEVVALKSDVADKLTGISVNGVAGTVVDGVASVEIDSQKIKLGKDIGSLTADKTVAEAIEALKDKVNSAIAGGLTNVNAGDGIIVSDYNEAEHDQNISVKISADANNQVKFGTDKGIYVAPLYYDGDDVEEEVIS